MNKKTADMTIRELYTYLITRKKLLSLFSRFNVSFFRQPGGAQA